MNYKEFAEHTESYNINGNVYMVTANFVNNTLVIKRGCSRIEGSLDAYTEFEGNMEEFVTDLLDNDATI